MMHELEMKLRDICEMKEKLTSWCKEAISKGPDGICVEELGQAIDMIKDLADAEEKCWKADYYKTVTMAMRSEDRMGYDNWRNSSTGEFANKGTGTYYGYPMEDGEWRWDQGPRMMGYPTQPKTSMRTVTNARTRYGYPYEEYKEAQKRNDRMGMTAHAEEHVKSMVESIQDIWQNASPDEREKLKRDMSALAEEMDL